jgi:hypothetical protein
MSWMFRSGRHGCSDGRQQLRAATGGIQKQRDENLQHRSWSPGALRSAGIASGARNVRQAVRQPGTWGPTSPAALTTSPPAPTEATASEETNSALGAKVTVVRAPKCRKWTRAFIRLLYWGLLNSLKLGISSKDWRWLSTGMLRDVVW